MFLKQCFSSLAAYQNHPGSFPKLQKLPEKGSSKLEAQACVLKKKKKNSPARIENHSCKVTHFTIATSKVPGVKARSGGGATMVKGPLRNNETLVWMEKVWLSGQWGRETT